VTTPSFPSAMPDEAGPTPAPRPEPTDYDVRCVIDVTATNPVEAAMNAQRMQREPGSPAGVYIVTELGGGGAQWRVDLDYPASDPEVLRTREEARLIAATGPGSQADRFSLDEEKARVWLGRIVVAYPDQAEEISGEAPVISAAWHTCSDGAEWTAERLVRGAVEDGILVCPAGMDVYFVYDEAAGDGGSYHFGVDIGTQVATQVSLATWGYEMRKLGDPGATGIEAALSVLQEARYCSNKALDNLALLLDAQGTRLARAGTDPAAGLLGDYPAETLDLLVRSAGELWDSTGGEDPHDVLSAPQREALDLAAVLHRAELDREMGSGHDLEEAAR
jgi:hypothetical protein